MTDKMWEFKYAPTKVEDMILPERESAIFSKWLNDKTLSNCLLVSANPGCGKTTFTSLFRNSKDFVCIFINASRETSIETVRETVSSFVKTVTISTVSGAQKVVILDEADRMSPNALDALKAEIEISASNARFIFTANRETAFPEPILSRLSVFNFDRMFTENRAEMMKMAFRRISYILDSENVKYDKTAIVELVKKLAPDWRSLVKTCQLLSAYDGTIDSSAVSRADFTCSVDELIRHLKEKNFSAVRSFSAKNSGNEVAVVGELWKLLDSDEVKNDSKPALVMLLAEANRYLAVVPDPEIELMNLFVMIMSENIL